MQPKLTSLWQLLIIPITGCLLFLPVRPVSAQTVQLSRNLTDADIDFSLSKRVRHDSFDWERDEIDVVNEFRRHVLSTDYGLQKTSAHRFMAIRRRLQMRANGSHSFIGDLAESPEAYTGHPIILFGLVHQIEDISEQVGGSGLYRVTLLHTKTRQPLAIVEFAMVESGYEPLGLKPVMVCGYPFKFVESTNGTDRLPYVIAQRLEWVRPDLSPDDFRGVTHRSRGISDLEADSYYETLKRARLLNNDALYQAGIDNRTARLKQLINDTPLQAAKLVQRAELYRSVNPDDEAGYARMMTQADDYLHVNLRRYERYANSPDEFPLFADVFKHPDAWQGKMVTMTGRVRKVMSYPPNEDDFELGMLHELWLYTDHSQRNPAVFVCTSLPGNFPSTNGTNVIDNVTVSGYFFKLYRYTAEDAHRLAPMLLGHTVTWNPVTDITQEGIPGWLQTLGIVGSVFGFVALLVYMANNHEQDRKFREQVRDGSFRAGPLDLEIVSGNEFDSSRESSNIAGAVDVQPAQTTSATKLEFDNIAARSQVETEQYEPADDHWIGRERVIGQKIRTVLRLPSAARELDGFGLSDSPTIVVLKNGYRFELAESELKPAGPGVRTGDLSRMKQRHENKAERFLGSEISNVLVDQFSNVYVILNGEQYLSTHDMPDDDSVRAPPLTKLFNSQNEIAFSDYWSQTPVSRTQLLNRKG